MSKVTRVWDQNKLTATDNLKLKLKVLTHFVDNGVPWVLGDTGELLRDSKTGACILDYCPTSAIQFSYWTLVPTTPKSLFNCPYVRKELEKKFGQFLSHGQSSLSEKKRPEEYALANQLFIAIKKVMQNQLASENKAVQIAELKTEVERYKAAAEVQATYVIHTARQNGELGKKVSTLMRAADGGKDILAAKDAKIAELHKEIAGLKKAIREISGFKGLPGGKK